MPFFATQQDRYTLEHTSAMLEDILARDLSSPNDRRFEEPPPPYTSSTESTRLTSPTAQAGNVDGVELVRLRMRARYKAMPQSMFELQTRREMERLLYQASASPSGRLSTLSFDQKLDIRANAENNVRQFWLCEGIWNSDWGRAWSPSKILVHGTKSADKTGVLSYPQPQGHWQHELQPEFTSGERAITTASISFLPGREEPPDSSATTVPNEDLNEPSRPYPQFMSQVSRERLWITDEQIWKGHEVDYEDVYKEAVKAVRTFWQENGLWQGLWNDYPGRSWAHEAPDPDLEHHPKYHQLYSGARGSVREAPISSLFRVDTAPQLFRQSGFTISRGLRSGNDSQKTQGLRRSKRLIEREKRTLRRSSRLQQQKVAKPLQRGRKGWS